MYKRQEQDPIATLEENILNNQIATEEELLIIKDQIKAEIDYAIKFAEESPFPDPTELYSDNYVQEDYPFLQ